MLEMCSRIPCWPLGPVFGVGIILAMLAVAGVIFSLVMLIDCLQRSQSEFANQLTKTGEYDKLIWAAVIVASLWFYFLGAIAYFFVVKRTKKQSDKK